ncbi:fungal-specific transcription factor domain-containing protein [Chlamydoabsidia padenii]|nr:fungal-specific transcription factor domain-containing protein [Chlamydoabsidia padenii]
MQHNGNAIQLVPPPPLGFPSLQLVQSLAKGIIEDLNKVEAELRQNTGVSLVIKQFEKPGFGQDETSSLVATPSTSSTTKSIFINDYSGCKTKKQKNDGRLHECKHDTSTLAGSHLDMNSTSNTVIPDNNNNVLSLYEMVLSQQTRPRTYISQHGHFMGETSYYSNSLSYSPLQQDKMQLDLVTRSLYALSTPIPPPQLTLDTQLHLIDVYYTHIHPHLPLINRQDLLLELDRCNLGQPSYLSPLFFYALFARSAPFSNEPHRFIDNSNTDQTIDSFATRCLQYANQLRDTYLHQPRISTVFALLLMALHLEQSRRHEEFSRVWIWAGEAFRMILDLGLHRYNSFTNISSPPIKTGSSTSSPLTSSSSSSSLCDPMDSAELATIEHNACEQFGIRTFWAAFVFDRSLSLVYGRPFTLEERDIDVPLPKALEHDDQDTITWMATFLDRIDICKIMGRVAKFNYSPHSSERGPIRHQDAMLSTLDSWITSLLKDFSPSEDITRLAVKRQHVNIIRRLELYTLLILLHRPYIQEHSAAKSSNGSSNNSTNNSYTGNNNTSRPSLDICSHTAMIITQLTADISTDTLVYLSKTSPMVTYAMIMALRIHLLNASASAHDQKSGAFGEINFEHTLELLRTIPTTTTKSGTMLSESIDSLENQYKQRPTSILSGFTRPSSSYTKYSSSPRLSGSLDSRLRLASTQSEGSTSSFDSDPNGSSSKRPYESDSFTSGYNNGNSNSSSNSNGNTMAKPMQKLKIIEVHPSKGKQKKFKSLTPPNIDPNNNSKLNTSTSNNTRQRSGGHTIIINEDERRGPSRTLNNHKESREPTTNIGPTTKKTTPMGSSQHFIIDNNHTINNDVRNNDDSTNSLLPTSGIMDGQQHQFYQTSNQHYQHVNQVMPVYSDSQTSSNSSHQSFIQSAGTSGMEYGMNTLFTFGDGLTGDHSSSLLYEQFFASTNNNDGNHLITPVHLATSSTTTTATSAPMSYDDASLGGSIDLPSSYSSYLNNPPLVYSNEQSSSSTLFIPSSNYLPSR